MHRNFKPQFQEDPKKKTSNIKNFKSLKRTEQHSIYFKSIQQKVFFFALKIKLQIKIFDFGHVNQIILFLLFIMFDFGHIKLFLPYFENIF